MTRVDSQWGGANKESLQAYLPNCNQGHRTVGSASTCGHSLSYRDRSSMCERIRASSAQPYIDQTFLTEYTHVHRAMRNYIEAEVLQCALSHPTRSFLRQASMIDILWTEVDCCLFLSVKVVTTPWMMY